MKNIKTKIKKKDADESWSAPAMYSDYRYNIIKVSLDAVDEVARKTFSR